MQTVTALGLRQWFGFVDQVSVVNAGCFEVDLSGWRCSGDNRRSWLAYNAPGCSHDVVRRSVQCRLFSISETVASRRCERASGEVKRLHVRMRFAILHAARRGGQARR